MSDTEKREAVLEEFAPDAGVHRVWGVAGMADEIVCLRSANKDLIDHYEDARAEIDRLRARCRQIDDEAYDYAEQIEQLKAAAKDSADHYADARAEIDRLTRILAALLSGFERRGLLPEGRPATDEDAQEAVALLFERLDRAERILAALPNPIARKMLDRDGIDEASAEQWREAVDDANRALRAAVEAAEQEVGGR